MSWYKYAQQEVIITSYGNHGITAYIDGKKYFCPKFNPKLFGQLRELIKNKAWGKAKQVLKNWPCDRDNEQERNQMKLF